MWIPIPLKVLVLLVCVVPWGCSLPSGAPSEACGTLSPDPSAHDAEPQTTPAPYEIGLESLEDENGGHSYVPGETYTCMLHLQLATLFLCECRSYNCILLDLFWMTMGQSLVKQAILLIFRLFCQHFFIATIQIQYKYVAYLRLACLSYSPSCRGLWHTSPLVCNLLRGRVSALTISFLIREKNL